MKKENYRKIDANCPLQVALIGYRPSVPQRAPACPSVPQRAPALARAALPDSGLWFDFQAALSAA